MGNGASCFIHRSGCCRFSTGSLRSSTPPPPRHTHTLYPIPFILINPGFILLYISMFLLHPRSLSVQLDLQLISAALFHAAEVMCKHVWWHNGELCSAALCVLVCRPVLQVPGLVDVHALCMTVGSVLLSHSHPETFIYTLRTRASSVLTLFRFLVMKVTYWCVQGSVTVLLTSNK